MSVAQFFGDVAEAVLPPIGGARREREAHTARMRRDEQAAILTGHKAAMETAAQYGDPGSDQWRQAYVSVAQQAGVPQAMIDTTVKLSADPKLAALTQLGREASVAKQNWGASSYGGGDVIAPDIEERRKKLSQPQDHFDPGRQTAGRAAGVRDYFSTRPQFDPAAAAMENNEKDVQASAFDWNAQGPPDSPALATQTPPSKDVQASPFDWATQGPPGATGPDRSAVVPKGGLASLGGMFGGGLAGTQKPQGVAAGGEPTTLTDLGVDNRQMAQQFQELEAILGKSLPGFDLRADYRRDPEFYRELLAAIQNGVKDEKNPGQKRKLSAKEIIALIRG